MKRDTANLRYLIADMKHMYAMSLHEYFSTTSRVEQITVAKTKPELLQLMDECRHDLLIIEPCCRYEDAGVTDFEFLCAFRARYPTIPILVFTGEICPHMLRCIARLDRIGLASKADNLDDVRILCERVAAGERNAISSTVTRILNCVE
jgi:DNA-binding NarL/FixJ family response regulator